MDKEILDNIKEENNINPNEIIEIEEEGMDTNVEEVVNPEKNKKKNNKKKKRKSKLSKKQKIIIICIVVVILLVVIGVLLYFFVFKSDEEDEANKITDPLVIVELENYIYEDGILVFLTDDDKELGTYECTNKDEDLCYVAYYSLEDDFDVSKDVYENGTTIQHRSDIFSDNYVFIYDNSSKSGGDLTLYNISDESDEGTYDLVKKISDTSVITSQDGEYGVLEFTEDEISIDIKLSYDYMGYIEDSTYLVVKEDNNYYLIDFTGKSVSKTVPGEIKSFSSNLISVKVSGEYYVYDYKGNVILDDTYDYIRLVDSYIIAVDNKKVYGYDSEGTALYIDAIKISSTSYNTEIIYDSDGVQTGKEEAFNAYINGNTLYISFDDEVVSINTLEAKFNKTLEYVSYYGGKLYFYSDSEKTDLLGTYACSYANSITEDTTELTNCFIAKESNILDTSNEKIENGYLPIYNNRFVFIADTKNPSSNDSIVLYDLKTSKNKVTYLAVDAGFHDTSNTVNFITTAGTLVTALNSSNSYGVINISSSSVDGVIAFKNDEVTNTEVKMLGSYYLFKRSDGTYHLYKSSGDEITENVSTTYEIVEYTNNYLIVQNDAGNYYIYNIDGKIVSNESLYLSLEDDWYISINTNKILEVYGYDKTNYETYILSEDENEKISKNLEVSESEYSKITSSLSDNTITIKVNGSIVYADID